MKAVKFFSHKLCNSHRHLTFQGERVQQGNGDEDVTQVDTQMHPNTDTLCLWRRDIVLRVLICQSAVMHGSRQLAGQM